MSDLGSLIVQAAKLKLGKKVGTRGECWDLGMFVLNHTKSKTPYDYGDDLYVWGDVIDLKDAGPGDILQLENLEITRSWTSSDGSKSFTQTFSFPHHTAVIESRSGDMFVLIHQNYEDVKKVTRLKDVPLGASYIVNGTVTAYRAVKK